MGVAPGPEGRPRDDTDNVRAVISFEEARTYVLERVQVSTPVRVPVDEDALSDRGGIAAELALPVCVGEDHGAGRIGLCIRGCKHAAERASVGLATRSERTSWELR